MKGIFSLGELKKLFTGDGKVTAALIIGAVLIAALALSGLKSGKTEKSAAAFSLKEQAEYEAVIEKRLTSILSGIDGVGDIDVMVTLDSTERTEYGKTQDMLISVKMPQVRGVIVVCGGGNNAVIQEKVIRAVSGVLGISSAHISVIK